jgi:hypothetical protein
VSINWGRRKGDIVADELLRVSPKRVAVPPAPDTIRLHRLEQLLADICTRGFNAPAESWLDDELWQRITAEVPGAPTRSTATTDEEPLW